MKLQYLITPFLLLGLVGTVLTACTDSTWRNDPAVASARNACQTQSGVDYDCVERAAVAALNPEICRLVGISIDDMCLQAVYEAANDPSICDQIYLPGVVPNCRAYYAQFTQATTPPIGTSEKPTFTQTPFPSYAPPPTASPTRQPTLTPSPTPLFVFDLSRYDPDLFQPIDLQHRPPMIANVDETVLLMFDVVNTINCPDVPRICRLEPTLYYSYGDAEVFQSMPLTHEIIHEMESLVARLPATDHQGKALRYYAEFAVPEAGYTLRYPVEGTIDLFATPHFISIELPPEKAVEPADKVYNFFWGNGPDKVRRGLEPGGRYFIAPPALDVAQDGRIALMDPVNERILIFNPNEDRYSSVPMPFKYNLHADLAFDQNGQLVICDWAGEYVEGTPPMPFCYRLLPGGEVEVAAPVYVKFPSKITKDLKVLDQYDSRLVAPFNFQGKASSREIQRQKETWDLPFRLVEREGIFDWHTARFADLNENTAFEVHSAAGIGGLIDFEKTPQGYLLVLGGGEQVRAVWINPMGVILKDITLKRGIYTEFSLCGNAAVVQDGSLYILGSTKRGIEIQFVKAPLE